jgi:hypothetical protein
MFSSLNHAYDALMRPLADWPAEASCALVTTAVSVLLLIVFKYISWQQRIEAVKDRMTACVLGVWLYRDQPRMIARCQAGAMGHGLHYLGLSLLPLAVMAFPMILILAQMNAYFAYEPIRPGARATLTLTFDAARPPERIAAELTPPAGVRVEGVHCDPRRKAVSWRLACDRAPGGALRIDVDGRTIEKSLAIGPRVARIQPERWKGGFWTELLYPSERPLDPGGAAASIRVDHPPRDLWLIGRMDWIIFCFIVMLAAILLFRGPMGVAI